MKSSILGLLLSWCILASGANGKLFGIVLDNTIGEALIGVNIIATEGIGTLPKKSEQVGTTTDIDGKYELLLPPGNYVVEFKYIGYDRVKKRIKINEGEELQIDVRLEEEAKELGIVTVSASKYEKKFGEESVSIEVLTPEFISNTNSITLAEALTKVPGVNMVGGNLDIHGGAGFSAGAGSRVLMLLDGIPLLTPHSDAIEFGTLPIENIKQVEIIKGAASALYGSSALNGIVNVITKNPGNKPELKLNTYIGFYENPFKGDKKDLYWSNDKQLFYGLSAVYRKRIKRTDLVFNGALNNDEHYLFRSRISRGRFNIKFRHRPKNNDNLTIGMNTNFGYRNSEFFFLWREYGDTAGRVFIPALNPPLEFVNPNCNCLDSLAYTPIDSANKVEITVNVDPYLVYFDKKERKHSLKSRFYYTTTDITREGRNKSNLNLIEYTFHSSIKPLGLDFVTGAMTRYSYINSEISGRRDSWNSAIFLQVDKKYIDKLTLTAGFRTELFKVDTIPIKIIPIGRGGVNYKITNGSYLRASFGQGYRYPSIAELFSATERAGQIVVPNPDILPERSWSAEIGYKQEFKISKWVGYLDLSGFVTRYYNMIEFVTAPITQKKDLIDQYFPQYSDLTGVDLIFKQVFWAQNVTDARISGFEISAFGQGKIFGIKTNFLVGYTFLNPIDLNYHPDSAGYEFWESNVLNFRTKHTAKADIETEFKNLTLGITATVRSFMENIGDLELAPFGIKAFRDVRNGTDFIIDARIAYQFSKKIKLALIAKNLSNLKYTTRPGFMEPPRNYTVQLSYDL